MFGLTALERRILLQACEHPINVDRRPGAKPVVLTVGETRYRATGALDALSELYSKGLVFQKQLNRFALTPSGRRAVKSLLEQSRN